ncbi:hypothetical protein [Martelella alba]|uniref:Uncharacterized protein n=1 Tax=Martelella alba TaxID=2590451 RepID=A0ABY2SF85_9HYPH|nr:hypothetical protein [Martelella alba]TKI02585.1 hypothetical protein FCN80_24505 [Martelella alba]
MSNNNTGLYTSKIKPDWVTIREAIGIINRLMNEKITDSDIYRHALYGHIHLSIYFQSPVILRKIRVSKNKLKLRPIEDSFINQLCLLDRNSFLGGRKLIFSTEGRYFTLAKRIIDTSLAGYEYVMVQRLLARTLNIPSPVIGANEINHGITVTLSGEIFQAFEKMTWQERIKQQGMRLSTNTSSVIDNNIRQLRIKEYCQVGYFPLYDLPRDACFVIRRAELEKLINVPAQNKQASPSSTRISTPLSRLFWLACKHNEVISPLIRQPYKLLSIFEQWASDDGITDRLSGDTLKNALERGSPSFTSLSH